MKKKPQKPQPPPPIRNWVAKHSAQIHRHAVHKNPKLDYKRSPKHKSRFGDFSLQAA